MIININNKIEQLDQFITIEDINSFYGLEEETMEEYRTFFEECAKVGTQFGLNIIELNYLYCAMVWKNGFDIYALKLVKDDLYRKSFLRIIENTILQTFDYKTYIGSIKLEKFMRDQWDQFYSHFSEFQNLNTQFENLADNIIVDTKNHNYFFNKEEMVNKNVFFKLYLNILGILRSINDQYFHFSIDSDPIMSRIQFISEEFSNILIEELYGSMFYLLMRNDKTFLSGLDKYAYRYKFIIPDLSAEWEELK